MTWLNQFLQFCFTPLKCVSFLLLRQFIYPHIDVSCWLTSKSDSCQSSATAVLDFLSLFILTTWELLKSMSHFQLEIECVLFLRALTLPWNSSVWEPLGGTQSCRASRFLPVWWEIPHCGLNLNFCSCKSPKDLMLTKYHPVKCPARSQNS